MRSIFQEKLLRIASEADLVGKVRIIAADLFDQHEKMSAALSGGDAVALAKAIHASRKSIDRLRYVLRLEKRAENEPTNPDLWSRAQAEARSKYDVHPSAYSNAYASKWYKERGGKWKKKKSKKKKKADFEIIADLRKWFKEEWVDISRKNKNGTHPPCGRSDADEGAYPKCQPKSKSKKMTKKEKDSASKRKRSVENKSKSRGKGRKPNYVPTKPKKKKSKS